MQANKYQNSYFEKQESFKALVREIQHFLQSKEGKPENCSVEEYIRKKWNISKYVKTNIYFKIYYFIPKINESCFLIINVLYIYIYIYLLKYYNCKQL